METLKQKVYDGREAVELREVGRDKDLIYLVVIAMKEQEDEVVTILKTVRLYTGAVCRVYRNHFR